MRSRNTKLFKAMMLGAMAILMISAHKASAANQHYFHSKSKSRVNKVLQLNINQSADTRLFCLPRILQG